jgi:hypothetical protein
VRRSVEWEQSLTAALLRLIVQYSGVDRRPSLYTFAVPRRSGDFLGSLLYSYKLNYDVEENGATVYVRAVRRKPAGKRTEEIL